jgi:hypothetical protein
MSYEVLSFIVAVNAVVTFSLIRALWQMDAAKANRPARLSKKAAKLLRHGDPIVPRHDPPKIDFSKFSGNSAQSTREFFRDFKEFADVMNSDLAESYGNWVVPSRFRLQDRPEDDVGRIIRFRIDGRSTGRCFQLFYNEYPVGLLEIEQVWPGYSTETPIVLTNVEIDMARYLRYNELKRFLETIASYVTKFNPIGALNGDYVDARLDIDAALTEALWGEDQGDLLVQFRGQAEYYMYRRADWLKNTAKSTAGAGSASNNSTNQSANRPPRREPGPKPDPRFNDRGPFRRDN